MKTKVVYYSRTGVSRRVAGNIASALNLAVVEITDNMNWKGLFGYIKAGYYASKDKEVFIEVNGELQDAEEYIVVTPIWAGGPASAIRTLLKTIPSEKVTLVVTCKGSDFSKQIEKYESHHEPFKRVYGVVESNKNEATIVQEILKSFS